MRQKEIRGTKKRTIDLLTRCRIFNIFPGEWPSIYKGEGVEFADVKPFELGDDPKAIDPRTMGAKDEMRVIQRVTDKQLKIYIWADYSGSMQRFEEMLFPQKPWIRDIAVGLVLFSAVKIYSPISFYPFGLTEKKFFPPKMGESYCLEILNWLADDNNLRHYTSSGVEKALISLSQLAHPRNIVFFISDFKQKVFEENFASLLKGTAVRFDFIPVIVRDPLEKRGSLKASARIKVQSSSERGRVEEIRLTPAIIKKIQDASINHISHLKRNFRELGLEQVVLEYSSINECCKTLSGFFQTRKRINY